MDINQLSQSIREATRDAEMINRQVDNQTAQLCELIEGRLRKVSSWRGIAALKKIKAELRDFDARTGRWK